MTSWSLPAEARLLWLLAVRPEPPCGAELAARLEAPIDWERLVVLSSREKLLPVVWSRLRGVDEAVPPEIAREFRRRAQVTEFRMQLTGNALAQLVSLWREKGVSVVLLKGAALAATVYGSFALRPMHDLDVLIRSEEAELAWRLARDAGWTPETEGTEGFYEDHYHLLPLVDPRGLNLVLEIHRKLLPERCPVDLDVDELWRDSRPACLGALPVRTLSRSHQLLYLCLHLSWGHELARGQARAARDIGALMASAQEEDWEEFVEAARRSRATQLCYWPLRITRTMSDGSVPERILKALRPPRSEPALRALERAYLTGAVSGYPSLRTGRLLWTLGMAAGPDRLGAARPWDRSNRWLEEGGSSGSVFVPQTIPERLVHHLRPSSLRSWLRFVGSVALPGRTP